MTTTTATKPETARLAYTLQEVAEMISEPVATVAKHCRTQALLGAYKTGNGGRTAPWRIPPAAIEHYQATRKKQ